MLISIFSNFFLEYLFIVDILHVGKLNPELQARVCSATLSPDSTSTSSSSSIHAEKSETHSATTTTAENNHNRTTATHSVRNTQQQQQTLFVQWCRRKPYMLQSCQSLDDEAGPGTCQNMQRMPLANYQSEALSVSLEMATDRRICDMAMCIAL